MTESLRGAPLFVKTVDGVRIAVHEVARDGTHEQAVVLSHGTFSNAVVCMQLARSLARAGFATYVLEWRGHGHSQRGERGASFETAALNDVPATLDLVRARAGVERFLWVGHSGGGLLPVMLMARSPAVAASFDGVVTLATQAADAGGTIPARVGIAGAALLTNVLRRAPGRALKLGTQDEPPRVMNPWYRWNLTGRWIGTDGFDYRAAAARLNVPILAIAGGGDRFIAPPYACRRFVDALGSVDKEFVLCSRSTGYAEDYDHGRLIASRGAVREVWPRVTGWLKRHATSRSSHGAAVPL